MATAGRKRARDPGTRLVDLNYDILEKIARYLDPESRASFIEALAGATGVDAPLVADAALLQTTCPGCNAPYTSPALSCISCKQYRACSTCPEQLCFKCIVSCCTTGPHGRPDSGLLACAHEGCVKSTCDDGNACSRRCKWGASYTARGRRGEDIIFTRYWMEDHWWCDLHAFECEAVPDTKVRLDVANAYECDNCGENRLYGDVMPCPDTFRVPHCSRFICKGNPDCHDERCYECQEERDTIPCPDTLRSNPCPNRIPRGAGVRRCQECQELRNLYISQGDTFLMD